MISEAIGKSLCIVRFEGDDIVNYEMYNEGKGEGVIVALKSEHYWRIKGVKKERRSEKQYEKPTIVIDYISESANKKIKEEFKKRDLDCNISFKATRLYDICESQSRKEKEDSEGQMEGVVYKMVCKKCEEKGEKKVYIGETGRKLDVRMREHGYRNKDELKRTETYRHSEEEHGEMKIKDWGIEVVKREKKEFDRKLKEAIEISLEEKSINKSEGMTVIGREWWRKKSERRNRKA